MSGIIPPSIVTYQYKVDEGFDKYVNAAFPFPVKIEQIWFTGDRSLVGNEGDVMDLGRGLKLAALKAKNPRKVDVYDAPSDWANFFGGGEGDVFSSNEDLKPTMWMGNPDDHGDGDEETDGDGDEGGDGVTQWLGMPWWDAGFRSSAAGAPPIDSPNNPFWYNNDADDQMRNYKTDLSIMLPDEILSMFVYPYTGDWGDYDGEGLVTVHIAYTGSTAAKTKDLPGAWGPWW